LHPALTGQELPVQLTAPRSINNLESVIAISLAPGSYTAIVSGKNAQTGVALIEAYDEQ